MAMLIATMVFGEFRDLWLYPEELAIVILSSG